jgi:hypothetical protein
MPIGIESVKEFGQSIKISIAFYIFSLVIVGIGAWYVSDVHTRFSLQNEKIRENKAFIDYVNDRHDRKQERMQGEFKDVEKRVNELEKPNTDK